MKDLESNFSTKYPFKTLSIARVPVQFHSYPKESHANTGRSSAINGSSSERLSTMNQAGFLKLFNQQKKG